MTRVLLAASLAIAALLGGSVLVIERSTSSERPSVFAPDADAAVEAVARVPAPVSTRDAAPLSQSAPVTIAAATSGASVVPRYAVAERRSAGDLSVRHLAESSFRTAGPPGARRLVMSARDRRLRVAHPEILAQPRSTPAAAATTMEEQVAAPNAPCAGSECDAAQDVLEQEASASQ